MGILFGAAGGFLGYDIYLLWHSGNFQNSIFKILIPVAAIAYMMTFVYAFPLLARFNNTVLGTIRNAFRKMECYDNKIVLDMYKRIAGIETDEEAEEMLEELIDRFGEPPKSVQNLLTIARLKAVAHSVYIKEIVPI